VRVIDMEDNIVRVQKV